MDLIKTIINVTAKIHWPVCWIPWLYSHHVDLFITFSFIIWTFNVFWRQHIHWTCFSCCLLCSNDDILCNLLFFFRLLSVSSLFISADKANFFCQCCCFFIWLSLWFNLNHEIQLFSYVWQIKMIPSPVWEFLFFFFFSFQPAVFLLLWIWSFSCSYRCSMSEVQPPAWLFLAPPTKLL